MRIQAMCSFILIRFLVATLQPPLTGFAAPLKKDLRNFPPWVSETRALFSNARGAVGGINAHRLRVLPKGAPPGKRASPGRAAPIRKCPGLPFECDRQYRRWRDCVRALPRKHQ